MTITALHSAATGMRAMDTQLDVIANNLANTNTTGFKSSRVNFEDLFYEERRQPGALNSLGQRTSTGLFVGLGTRVSNTQLNMQNGSLENTGRPLDVAIMGEGFFKVQTFDGIGGGEAYTRAGNLMIDSEGNLILGTADSPLLEPQINFPAGTDPSTVTIMGDGRISAMVDGQRTRHLPPDRWRHRRRLLQTPGRRPCRDATASLPPVVSAPAIRRPGPPPGHPPTPRPPCHRR